MEVERSIRSAVEGYPEIESIKFGAVAAGIKKEGLDSGLVFFEKPFSFVSLYTKNRIKASHIIYNMRLRTKMVRALFVNSGCANAFTGEEGIEDLEKISKAISERLNIPQREILFASTGVIGKRLPLERILEKIPALIDSLDNSKIVDFAKSIMTTDTYEKIVKREIQGKYKILGVAKGAGMISPSFATMLCFLFTDFPISSKELRAPLRKLAKETLERITVDGELSTNDTLMVFHPEGDSKGELKTKFFETLREVLRELSVLIVRDGEGATKLVRIIVDGCEKEKVAERIARRIAKSLLFKTAVYGADPNWGRIVAALGDSGVSLKATEFEIWIQGIPVARDGVGLSYDEKILREKMKEKEVEVRIRFSRGKKSFEILTTDLTEGYVRINSSYTS